MSRPYQGVFKQLIASPFVQDTQSPESELSETT